jgi:hypothetical protein
VIVSPATSGVVIGADQRAVVHLPVFEYAYVTLGVYVLPLLSVTDETVIAFCAATAITARSPAATPPPVTRIES